MEREWPPPPQFYRCLIAHLRGVPGPVPVLLVLGESPEVEVGLDRLRPQDVVPLRRLDRPRLHRVREPERLGAELKR